MLLVYLAVFVLRLVTLTFVCRLVILIIYAISSNVSWWNSSCCCYITRLADYTKQSNYRLVLPHCSLPLVILQKAFKKRKEGKKKADELAGVRYASCSFSLQWYSYFKSFTKHLSMLEFKSCVGDTEAKQMRCYFYFISLQLF